MCRKPWGFMSSVERLAYTREVVSELGKARDEASTIRAEVASLRQRIAELEFALEAGTFQVRSQLAVRDELRRIAEEECEGLRARVRQQGERIAELESENARLREALRFCRDVSARARRMEGWLDQEERDDDQSVAWLCAVYGGALRGIHATAAAALGEVPSDG